MQNDTGMTIGQKPSWQTLYRTSPLRANILRHLDFAGTERVLEICRAESTVTAYLRTHAASVDTVCVADDSEVELEMTGGTLQLPADARYELIVVTDAFADIPLRPYHSLISVLLSRLASGGRLLIAAENRLGLKYFAGNREVYTGEYFHGIEGYTGADRRRSFSRKEWIGLLEEAGAVQYRFCYPFPDHVFPMQLFTDAYLPRREELLARSLNFDRDRMTLFDDERVMQSLLDNDLFPAFSNSFLIEIDALPDASGNRHSAADTAAERVIYAKYANERAPEFSMCTQIRETADGTRSVRKLPASEAAEAHTVHIADVEQKLRALYADRGTGVNRCDLRYDAGGHPYLWLEYLTGSAYEGRVDAVLQTGGAEAARAMTGQYLARIVPQDSLVRFYETEQFREIFGVKEPLPDWKDSLPVTNLDAIMANLICTGQTAGSDDPLLPLSGQMFDYEWTFDFPIPVQFLIWRILNYYLESNRSRRGLDPYRTYAAFGIPERDIPVYRAMEDAFQTWVRGGARTLQELYEELTPGHHAAQYAIYRERSDNALQVYFDTGGGYTEQNTMLYPTRDGEIEQTIPLPQGTRQVRLDPGARSCICRILLLEEMSGRGLTWETNGYSVDSQTILFPEDDPQILLKSLPEPCGALRVSLAFSPVRKELAASLAGRAAGKYGLKSKLLQIRRR